jgi:hypothetical protein
MVIASTSPFARDSRLAMLEEGGIGKKDRARQQREDVAVGGLVQ